MSYQPLSPGDDIDDVPGDDIDDVAAVVVSAEAVTVKTSTSKRLEAQGLTWTDSYFETSNTNGVIAVFDMNDDLFRWRIRLTQGMLIFLAIFYCVFVALPLYPVYDPLMLFLVVCTTASCGIGVCQMNKQLKGVNGLHLAVTEEGIHTVMNGFPVGAFFRTTTVVRFVCGGGCACMRRCKCRIFHS
jgi:hypothetical protein